MADGGGGRAHGHVEEVLGGEGRCRGGHGEVASLAAGVVRFDVGEDRGVALHGGLDGADMDLVSGDVRLHVVGGREGGGLYPTKGPELTQPPPFPEGSQMRPAPTTLPLWAKKAPSPPRLVSLPSKTGDLKRSSWYLNQFQYWGNVSRRVPDSGGDCILAGSLCNHTGCAAFAPIARSGSGAR